MSSKKHYTQNKQAATQIIISEVKIIAEFYGVSINRITIRNQKTRWGSCSRKGNLNFNYKLLFVERELRTAVIVHEICHLLEFNHSIRFWNQVARYVPNYKILTKKLRKINIRSIE